MRIKSVLQLTFFKVYIKMSYFILTTLFFKFILDSYLDYSDHSYFDYKLNLGKLFLTYYFHFIFWLVYLWRSSRPEVFCKNRVLRFFTKFTGTHLCQSLFFNKIAGVRPTTLLKRRLWQRFFPVNSVKLLRKPFFTEHPWWLLLFISRQLFHDLGYRRTSCFKLLLNTWATCIESISTWKHALK